MESPGALKDLRGPQTRITRLLSFSLEAYVHVLCYRIMIPLAILYGLVIFAYLFIPRMGVVVKVFTAVMWVLWTPQFFEVAKGLSLAWSRGMAFGHLNREFAALYRKRYSRKPGGYIAVPFVALALWVAGFVVMLLRWSP